MPRYKITIEYDGSDYVGWQRQDNGLSVQQVVEQAVQAFCGEKTGVQSAGRTDTGVHALGQCAHFDTTRDWPADEIMGALNYHLRPAPIVIRQAEQVSSGFNARFDAVARHYLYRIVNRRAEPALDRRRVWHVAADLDAAAMAMAARELVGKHDFTTFRAAQCQAKSPVKTLDRLEVERQGEEILIRAEARSFLHHQVRSLVGTLKMVGEGKWTAKDVAAALAACDRKACGPTAPPHGLYLVRVVY